jgi:hypothetical protein
LVSTAQVFFWGGMMIVLIVSGFAELFPGLPILYATGWLLSAVGCVIYAFNLLLADNASA